MAVRADAPIEVTCYSWVPDFARGLVRDVRVRWALEEAGLDYRERAFDTRQERPAEYFREQPFGAVPAYRDDKVQLFESGAIVLYIGERCETLLPRDAAEKARATAWVIAALNSVEPYIIEFAVAGLFSGDQEWARLKLPIAEEAVRVRLQRLSEWLGDKDYLEDRFTAGDLVMCAVLQILRNAPLLKEFPSLSAYLARCEARTAFQRAHAAQMAAFTD